MIKLAKKQKGWYKSKTNIKFQICIFKFKNTFSILIKGKKICTIFVVQWYLYHKYHIITMDDTNIILKLN